MLAISYDEDVSMWIKAINQWIRTASAGQVQFAQLCQGLEMPQNEVWLSLLMIYTLTLEMQILVLGYTNHCPCSALRWWTSCHTTYIDTGG